MNTPAGFSLEAGVVTRVDQVAALFNPGALGQTVHMALAAYGSVGFAVAGIHAYLLLRRPGNVFHVRALRIALWVGGIAAVVRAFGGDTLRGLAAQDRAEKHAGLE